MHRLLTLLAVLLAVPVLIGADESAKEALVPGLGEFMTATQLRHAKLWFAGAAKNWDLAAFEIEEIEEGLEDAARLHPPHDGMPVADMIKAATQGPLDELARAVEAKSSADFERAFDTLTVACNGCHAANGRAYIKIKRPSVPPVTNQEFAPGKD